MGYEWVYPPVSSNMAMENHYNSLQVLMGKSSENCGFSIAMVDTGGYQP
jgi:hypothetical protein